VTLSFGWTIPDLWQLGVCMDWMEKNMAKKTKKQIAAEKRLAKLKKDHTKLAKAKRVIQTRLNREGTVREKQLGKLDKAIERAQVAFNRLDAKSLPSEPDSRKISDKLVALEDKIRMAEGMLRAFTPPAVPPSASVSDGEEAEE
jgi:chromosome segregation ATPase